MKPTMSARKFTTGEIENFTFQHQFREMGVVQDNLVIVREFDDGYASVRFFNGKGLMEHFIA